MLHVNSQLQRDWSELAADKFTCRLIEEKEVTEDTETRWELRQMEKVWLERLHPYGDRGNNKPPRD